MQGVSKEWLDFLRNQFPAGSRIQTWELDDPRNTLEEAGTLEHIDDSGRFHVRQSDGGECVLTLGEEMFSVHPPESTQLKLYMPLTASFYARNEWGDWDETGEEWDGRTLLDYEDRILGSWCGTGPSHRCNPAFWPPSACSWDHPAPTSGSGCPRGTDSAGNPATPSIHPA